MWVVRIIDACILYALKLLVSLSRGLAVWGTMVMWEYMEEAELVLMVERGVVCHAIHHVMDDIQCTGTH